MTYKKRTVSDTEKLSGRVLKGVFERFRSSISPREKVIDHLSAALMVWNSLRPEAKTKIMEVIEENPETDLLLELLYSMGLDAAKVVREAEARYQVQKQKTPRKSSATG